MQGPDRRQDGRPFDYRTLVADFSGRVYRQAYRILGSRQDAEDATQEVFLKVYKGLHEFRGEAQIATWIYRITFNVCAAMQKKRRIEHVSIHGGDEASQTEIPDPDSGPAEALVERDRLERLSALIALLPEREAAAITLFYMEEMSYADISRILDIPPGSVATALHNGRERLRRHLMKERE